MRARFVLRFKICSCSIFIILIAFAFITTHSLRMTSIEVPSAVMNSSQEVVLVCNYELQDDQLYSVKWYKNYVEFYRFQPNNLEFSSFLPQTGSVNQDSQVEFQQKKVFELEGIDPDLFKCNSTHVYLKQISFASEGTFKCEVSADSPSFATVSIERQMKVYALPKQKLSIFDNSHPTSSTKQLENSPLKSRQSVSNSYALNDFINLTCSSGFSKPAAKLAWFINDLAVINSTEIPIHNSAIMIDKRQQLEETKLSLAFRIGPEHLFGNMYSSDTDELKQQNFNRFLHENNLRPLKLRCVSKLVVEYTSVTEIFVINGKSSQKMNRNLLETPVNSKFDVDGHKKSSNWLQSDVVLKGQANNSDEIGTNFTEYKWPPQLNSITKTKPLPLSDDVKIKHSSWTPAIYESSINHGDQEQTSELPYNKISTAYHRIGSPHNLVVWTNNQLRSQADLIKRMLSISHPNELEAPRIRANTQLNSITSDIISENNPLVISKQTSSTKKRKLKEFDNSGYTTTHGQLIQSEGYKLNDIVKFTCNAVNIFLEKLEVGKNVYLKWLIDDKEITSSYINAFNGSHFFHNVSLSRKLKPSILNYSTKTDEIYSHIFIQFTPSLFQLEELNLKCKTTVEQQLIEFENQLVLNVLIGHRFVKQDPRFYIKKKQVVGKGDGIKRGRNVISWPNNYSSSLSSNQKSSHLSRSSSKANLLLSLKHIATYNIPSLIIVQMLNYNNCLNF